MLPPAEAAAGPATSDANTLQPDCPAAARMLARRCLLRPEGVLSLLAAAALLLAAGLPAVTLVLIVAAWGVVTGVLRLLLALRTGDLLRGLAGAVAVFVGAWMAVAPGPGLLATIWLVGLQGLVAGCVLLGLGWRLRRIHHDPHGPAMGRG